MSHQDHMQHPRQVTDADKLHAFKRATASLPKRYGHEIAEGVTDARLTEILRDVLGTYAGFCGPGQLSVSWQGSGLRIWASWEMCNTVKDRPVFAGKATLSAARDVYGIKQPGDMQIGLF